MRQIDKDVTKWLLNHLNEFDFKEFQSNPNILTIDSLKPYCELCFLTNFLNTESFFYNELVSFLYNKIESFNWDYLLNTNPYLYIALLSVDGFYIKTKNKSIFKYADIVKFANLFIKNPYRMIETICFLSIYYNYPIDEIFIFNKSTVLGNNKNINLLSYMDFYSITHELMYVYFLIKHKQCTLEKYNLNLENTKNYLLDSLSFIALDGHIDIMAELILCLGLFDFIFNEKELKMIEKALLKIQDNTLFDGGILPHIKYSKNQKLNFNDLYHTTSVVKGMIDIWKNRLY